MTPDGINDDMIDYSYKYFQRNCFSQSREIVISFQKFQTLEQLYCSLY